MENKVLDFYRIKTEHTAECENGALSKVKTEELVFATSYTEAEKVAHELIETYGRSNFGSVNYEITKTKITTLLYNDVFNTEEQSAQGMAANYFSEPESSGVGLYAVSVIFTLLDEKSGKEKRSKETYYTPALSNSDANNRIKNYLNSSMRDYVIRDTKFDHAEAIYWPLDIHQQKVAEFDRQSYQ